MSNTPNRNLSREKMQQILASVGSQQTDENDKLEAAEYRWQQPHCFSSIQLKKLDNFTEIMVRNCAERFAKLYNSDFEVTITSTTQHFANEFADPESTQNDYYLTIETQGRPFGMVGIPSQTAIIWATQLLGDNKAAEDGDKDLSQLEQTLLFDVASGIIKALSDSYDDYNLQSAGKVVKGQMSIELKGTEELCKITFSVKQADSENSAEAYFLIFCDELNPVVGQNTQISEDASSEKIAEAMFGHVQKIPISVTAQLASTVLTFEEIMSLQVNDILLLDKTVDQPTELIVKGKTIFRGQPVKSSGSHAVLITELCGKE